METRGSKENSGQTLSTVDTAFEIVQILDREGGIRVSELADELAVSDSKAYIYLNTLRRNGYVNKGENRYRLSYKWLELAGKIRQRERLFHVGVNEVDKLALEVGELANLGIAENGQRVLLYKSEGQDAVTDKTPVGEHTYMHWSALGKAMLAFFDDDHIQEVVNKHGLPEATGNTIGDVEELYEELEGIRDQGYAFEDEEREYSMRAVAVPIRTGKEEPLGSLSISGPKNRLQIDVIEGEILDQIRSTADSIELKYNNY